MRIPGVYQRQRHMPGRWFSTTAGCFLEYESLLERDWMLLMDFDREVEWMCEQPLRLRYSKDGRPASHVPDLLVWRSGTPVLCDVKSAAPLCFALARGFCFGRCFSGVGSGCECNCGG